MADGDLVYLPEQPGAGRLGRHVHHDPRSRAFAAPMAPALRSVKHRHYGHVLDQGNVGSCTGNAVAQALNCMPLHGRGAKLLTEKDALAIYERATQLDPFDGTYPDVDTGSDGLDAAKAAAEHGWISEYRWAFGLDEALRALVLNPVVTGVAWYEGFDIPDSRGRVQISGDVRGGHEFAVVALDVDARKVRCLNSWSREWGDAGYFELTFDQWDSLLQANGDVTVLVR